MSGFGTPFQQLVAAVAQYYGSGSDQWLQIATQGTNAPDFIEICQQIPGVKVKIATDGSVLGYDMVTEEVVTGAAESINSNVAATAVKFQAPATTGVSQTTHTVVATKGVTTATGLQFITREVVPAIAAAGVGITLGKTIDRALYNANPDFWDENGMGAINPETWNHITTNDTVSGKMFNLMLGLHPTNKTMQAYIDQDALAYLAMYMQQNNFFGMGEELTNVDVQFVAPIYRYKTCTYRHKSGNRTFVETYSITNGYCTMFEQANGYLTTCVCSATQNTSYDVISDLYEDGELIEHTTNTRYLTVDVTYNQQTMYVAQSTYGGDDWEVSASLSAEQSSIDIMAYILLYGIYRTNEIPGVGTQTGGLTPDLANLATLAAVLAALQAQYPDLWNGSFTYPVLQEDGTVTNHIYVPIAIPDGVTNVDTHPVGGTDGLTQDKPQYDPADDPDNDIWDKIKDIIEDDTDNDDEPPINDDTGTGTTPPVVIPTGSASALYSVYNPTQSELNSFGSWLWSSNFVDQLLKLFNDPMQAIIGLHKVFVTPPTSGRANIKVGYLDSGVGSNLVNGQYVTVNCGSVQLNERFLNVFDYEPHTEVYIYLPFIGIHRLDTNDVMRGSINVVYHVDVITGAALAEVKVNRDGAGGTLYTFAGNCAVQYPVSSGSYMGILASAVSIAGGVVGTIASGGALAPVALGAVGGVFNAHANVSHSGGFSGNAGAMGIKKPYLIICRPQTALASNFQHFDGIPANRTTTLSECIGYVRCDSVHVENIPATNNELSEIETLLKTGVLI